jgi:hypothetical protein
MAQASAPRHRYLSQIASQADVVLSPAWDIEVLEKPLDAVQADGERGRPWQEVRRDLHVRLRAVPRK